jgi:hypothetical protein
VERNHQDKDNRILFPSAASKKEEGSSAVSRTTGLPAEVLQEGSGIKVDGTADDRLAAHLSKINAGNLPWQKTSRACFIFKER